MFLRHPTFLRRPVFLRHPTFLRRLVFLCCAVLAWCPAFLRFLRLALPAACCLLPAAR
ncbi:hypothetical protein [Streptomyces noursei]|uniref:hypothetical protein n=1 Tax=Streptomyces noursei TaxID=1971 RepID=UPI001677120C|nr:hypothetical protein [Streptomyces noursei]